MTIFDFDRVLFDTDAFIAALNEHGLGDLPRGQELLDAIEAAGIDWASFVHEGVLEYLETHPDCAIVSSYISRNRRDNDTPIADLELFQLEKIKRSGLFALAKKGVFVTQESKENEFKILSQFPGDTILVDDEREHVEVGNALGFRTVWFRTPKNLMNTIEGKPEFVEAHNVTSFSQFVELEKQWQTEKTEK